ncbi:MAG TPA: acetyl-CoA decarbonylase/synthase complex subunit gamma [Candidatus Margulisiibacteriota bacterium]|nr:acetyl-CoA decarbonylase/synthase complex subunit gamma [Candidatus Margulisiibacteriota bacterium]
MALSGLDIYKLLPKTNCRECGFATCLAFAMQLAKKAVSIEKCPYVGKDAKALLEASSLPPVRLVSVGEGESKLEVGNETVLFRHEEKFHHPCAIGFVVDDDSSAAEIRLKLDKINKFKFERVGQQLNVNLVAIRQKQDKKRFLEAVKVAQEATALPLMLMSESTESLKEALGLVPVNTRIIYNAHKGNAAEAAKLSLQFKAPLVVSEPGLEELSVATKELNSLGANDLILDTSKKNIAEKIWDLTQIRRQALKKNNRALGFPVCVIVDKDDPFQEAMEASAYIAKYAGIVLLKNVEAWQILSLLTLRQNIYTDPQKPLQIDPKLYAIGSTNKNSPVLVTTNFSLTYYTVLGEVEASKVPSYILSVDTEGMSVLTAWAAEKFTPEKIISSVNKSGVQDMVSKKRLVIPGYVAVLSGDLEENSGWTVVVGPKEAAGIPSFLKNL